MTSLSPAALAPTARAAGTREVAHFAYLDGLRALAAGYVAAGHAVGQVWEMPLHKGREGVPFFLTTVFGYGRYAVSVFIVLSGFCLMLPVVRGDGSLRGGALHFYWRRARRILPPYYLAGLVSLALIATVLGEKTGTHWDVTIPVTTAGIVEHLLLVQNFRGAPQINHVFWSIAVEWQIYFVFPLLVWAWARVSPFIVVAGALAVGYVAQYPLRVIAPDAVLHYVGLFALGMLACAIAHARDGRLARLRANVPWIVVGVAAAIAAQSLIFLKRVYLADAGVGLLALAVLVGVASDADGLLRRALSFRPIVWIGGFAYSLYLIHAPILQLFTLYVARPLGLHGVSEGLFTLAAGVPVSIVGAWLFYLACERPFIPRR